jgi:hypothetical protein
MFRNRKFLVSSLIGAVLLLSCSLSQRGVKGTVSMATGTQVAVPSDEIPIPTDEIAVPANESTDYLRELQDLGFGKYLDASDELRTKTRDSGWDIYHYDLSDCRCLLGTDYVLMARKGSESTKTVLWMEGGGACFPGRDECTKEAVVSPLKMKFGLASSNPHNPVKDWNYIYVPYCDGSIHLGDSDADYDNNGQPDHWHWGLKNTTAAVRLMKELFPQSREILVAGCSAGGYGTLGTTPIVRLQFPQANLYVLNESGLGLMNPALYDTYAAAYRIWNITPLFPPDCPLCGQQLIYIYPWMLARDPYLRVGVFSSYGDATFSANWEMAPQDFKILLLDASAAARADYPDRFHRYFIEGSQHCVLDYSYEVDGVTIWDWISYMLENDPRWTDVLE